MEMAMSMKYAQLSTFIRLTPGHKDHFITFLESTFFLTACQQFGGRCFRHQPSVQSYLLQLQAAYCLLSRLSCIKISTIKYWGNYFKESLSKEIKKLNTQRK